MKYVVLAGIWSMFSTTATFEEAIKQPSRFVDGSFRLNNGEVTCSRSSTGESPYVMIMVTYARDTPGMLHEDPEHPQTYLAVRVSSEAMERYRFRRGTLIDAIGRMTGHNRTKRWLDTGDDLRNIEIVARSRQADTLPNCDALATELGKTDKTKGLILAGALGAALGAMPSIFHGVASP